jgi:hypothetical protein
MPLTAHGSHLGRPPGLRILPTTELGRRAAWLAGVSVLLLLLGRWLPLGAALSFLSGLAGSVVALAAILRRGERALTVFVALLPGLFVIGFILAELLVGHD